MIVGMKPSHKKIICFDGECELCDRFVNYVFQKDKSQQFFYAPLQGLESKRLLGEEAKQLHSIVFFEGDKKYKQSQAIAQIMKLLYPKTTLIVFWLPYRFYNIFYRFLAKKRYKWFGKKTNNNFKIPKEYILS